MSMNEPVVGEWIVHGLGAGFLSSLAAAVYWVRESNAMREGRMCIVAGVV
jgi:hypothetical protein